VSEFFTKRQKLKGGAPPPLAQPRPDAGHQPLRRKGTQSTERDIKRFTTYLYAERGCSPLTVKKYVRAVKRLKEWARRKRKSLPELTTTDCRRWMRNVAREPYSVSTINGMRSAAASFYRFLLTDRFVESNPFDPIPYLPREETLPRYLSQEEVERLLNAPDTSTYAGLLDRTMMELLYATGMRPTELVNQRLDGVDLERRRIRCTGKGSKQRVVIFGRSARKWLEKYLAARSLMLEGRQSRHLFLKADGTRIYATYVWRRVKENGLMAGLEDVSPRMLRHTFATHLHGRGASIQHVQTLLGHDGVESTQVYTHLVPTHLIKTVDEKHPRASLKRGPPAGPRHRGRLADGEEAEE
jgi:integrase/recombinase XerD